MIVITATVDGQKCYLAGIPSSVYIPTTLSFKEAKRFPFDDLKRVDTFLEIVKKRYPDAESANDDLDRKTALEIAEDLKQQIDSFTNLSGDAFSEGWTEEQMEHFDQFLTSLYKTYRLLGTAIFLLKSK